MLIDRYLPSYDVRKRHQIVIHAPPKTVFDSVCNLDFSDSAIIRWLFKLRGMPSSAWSLQGLEQMRFAKLGEVDQQELLLGLVGRFWSIDGDLQPIDACSFEHFSKPGYARAVWNFYVEPAEPGSSRLSTETRVQCLDEASARRFKRYWAIIGPFSGWIRKEALQIVKRNAEALK